MSVKIKVSYENDQEREQILQMLQPVMGSAKMKDKKDKKPHKIMYIEMADTHPNHVPIPLNNQIDSDII